VAVNDQARALVKMLSVTPQDNDTSKALVKQADAKQAELAKLDGAAFDKAYADNEVATTRRSTMPSKRSSSRTRAMRS
jgi:putative membrane protein